MCSCHTQIGAVFENTPHEWPHHSSECGLFHTKLSHKIEINGLTVKISCRINYFMSGFAEKNGTSV